MRKIEWFQEEEDDSYGAETRMRDRRKHRERKTRRIRSDDSCIFGFVGNEFKKPRRRRPDSF